MTFRAAVVSAGTTATLLTAAEADTQAGSRIRVRNNAAATDAFLGGPDVTTATGYKLAATEQVALDLDAGEALYAVVAVGRV